MRYRELGKTGLMVSEIGFGAEWITGWEQQRVNDLVQACERAGVNIVDCWMADPSVRAALGVALAPHRADWIIQGHIGSTWQNGQYVRTREIDAVKKAFKDQLELLQTDYLDLGMIHFIDDVDEFATLMAGSPYLDYVNELHAAGVIRHVGISTHSVAVARAAAQNPLIEVIMFSLNPAFDAMPSSGSLDDMFGDFNGAGNGINPERAALYEECAQLGVGITVMKPFAGGRLLDAEKSPFGVAMTPAQCIAYALDRPAVASVMAGMSEPSHLEDALGYYTTLRQNLDYARILRTAPQHSYAGHCIYCGHCQPCMVGINIATVNKYYDLAILHESVPESIQGHYNALRAKASKCVACHACEHNCPFGVSIAERMAAAAALLG